MSIYANNYIIDEITGEKKLVKHLNKSRIDRGKWNSTPGGWNKSGKKARICQNNNNRAKNKKADIDFSYEKNSDNFVQENPYHTYICTPEEVQARKDRWEKEKQDGINALNNFKEKNKEKLSKIEEEIKTNN